MYSKCNLTQSVTKKTPIAFHNGCNYDYHFLIKKWPVELKKQVTCLGENIQKYINFTVLTEQEVTRTDKNEEEIAKNISCRLQFMIVPDLW